jgi:hypothetical protein
MSESSTKPELNNEYRYMALLALTSQQLPEQKLVTDSKDGDMSQTTKSESLYEQLDSDPAALESFLRRHASAPRMRKTIEAESFVASLVRQFAQFFAPSAIRYASAIGAVAVVAFAAYLAQRPDATSLMRDIESSYASVRFEPQRSPLGELLLPWERPPATVGFLSDATNDSQANISFAQGLLKGRNTLATLSGAPSTPIISSDQPLPYVALGEWNVLLWAVSTSGQSQSAEFWLAQQQLSDALAAASYDDAIAGAQIAAHLTKVDAILLALARGESPARNARALADELMVFREQFAPHDRSVLGIDPPR